MTDLRDRLKHEHLSDLSDEEIAAAQMCPSCKLLRESLEKQSKYLSCRLDEERTTHNILVTQILELTAQRDALVEALILSAKRVHGLHSGYNRVFSFRACFHEYCRDSTKALAAVQQGKEKG